MTDDMRSDAIHSAPTLGAKFSIVFVTRAHAAKFAEIMRGDSIHIRAHLDGHEGDAPCHAAQGCR